MMTNLRALHGNDACMGHAILEDRLYAGEAAGIQHAPFGFGLRYTLTPNHLAANTATSRTHDERQWQTRLVGPHAASVVNRWLSDWLSDCECSRCRCHREAQARWERST